MTLHGGCAVGRHAIQGVSGEIASGMRWFAAILGLVTVGLLYVLVRAQLAPDGQASLFGAGGPAANGMALLEDYRCRRGETRRVVVRGGEDGFSVAGDERAGFHPRLAPLEVERVARQVGYDDGDMDGEVADHFELPSRIASARFMLRLRPIGDNSNDSLRIGDLTSASLGSAPSKRNMAYASILDLARGAPWSRRGEVFWADIADLRTARGQTLLEFIQAGSGPKIIDVSVGDDTAVDFMAMAWCERPPGGKGLSFAHLDTLATMRADHVAFECRDDRPGGRACDPINGDHRCDAELPLLCYRDLGLPAPTGFPAAQAEIMTRRWSGGEVAATAPVAGDRFATIGAADRYCAGQFGEGWRVAEWHVSGRGWGFSARSGGRRFSGRYWVDIRGAPYGTCWRRDHGE